MTITPQQLKFLWTGKSKTGLDDATWRSALVQIAGVTSTKELDGDGFEAMMGFLQWLGFTPLQARGADYGDRPGMASFAQIELIRVLWHEYTRGEAGEDELNKWLERCWKVSSLRFLRARNAPKVITALKAMKARAA
ncbi:Mu-like prophage protein gp16 [Marinibacterium anthonyi]|nr:Mu-like prophage protein gp16 [Marinibacterium anthonyi]